MTEVLFARLDEMTAAVANLQAQITAIVPIDNANIIALSNLDATGGILTQTAAATFVKRTLTGTANEITVTNGDGVAGTPTLSLPTSLTFTGKTITGGSYSSPSLITPTVSTSITAPLLIGGTSASASLSLKSTSGVGTTDFINMAVGSNGAKQAMRVISNGNIGFGFETNPATNFVVSFNANKPTGSNSSGLTPIFYGIAPDGSGADFVIENYRTGGGPNIVAMFARGTALSPAVPQSGDQLAFYQGVGWNGTIFDVAHAAGFWIRATETWSGSVQGSRADVLLTATGTTTRSSAMSIFGDGTTSIIGSFASLAPVTKTGTTSTVANSESSTIYNPSGSHVTTLPAAASYSGRWWYAKLIAAFAVTSASSNVIPLAGGAASTTIFSAATAGKWAILQSDGTNWQIMAAN